MNFGSRVVFSLVLFNILQEGYIYNFALWQRSRVARLRTFDLDLLNTTYPEAWQWHPCEEIHVCLKIVSSQGRTLPHNQQQGIIISNQSLVLQGVSRSTAGNYSCVGFNAEGEGVSPPFELNVLCKFYILLFQHFLYVHEKFVHWICNCWLSSSFFFILFSHFLQIRQIFFCPPPIPYTDAPSCAPNQTRIYGVAKQENAQIKCTVEANPPEVEFRWTFNNSAESIDVAGGHVSRFGTSSSVLYTPMTELDYGTLMCQATNKIGRQKVSCLTRKHLGRFSKWNTFC